MAAAGVREVFIGQESGDQRILNLMKKGTKTSHIKPAIAALREAGIGATISFMHGFPGEDLQTIRSTRQLITELNEPSWSNPTAFSYIIYPFAFLDFAAVAQQSQFASVDHYLGYDSAPISGKTAAEESLATIIAASRLPYAPVYALITEAGPPTSGIPAFTSPNREAIFRWLKNVERGMAIFLERELDGRSAGDAELRQLRSEILNHMRPRSSVRQLAHRAKSRVSHRFIRRLREEWTNEAASGPGLVTKVAIAHTLGTQTHSIGMAAKSWSTASVPLGITDKEKQSIQDGGFAKDLVDQALTSSRRRRPATEHTE
jgi:hypothetical protein